MPRTRRYATLALLALPAGCIVPTGPAKSIAADVQVSTRGLNADSTYVSASFYALDGGDRIHFRSDTLRVQNVVAKEASRESALFFARVPLDSAAVVDGLRVRLPVPMLGAVPHSEFTVFSMARGGSASVALGTGQDLVLPIVRGSSGTLPGPAFEHWNVSFYRGSKGTTISGSGPIPSPVVVPWVLIPKEGSDTLKVLVSSNRQFRFDAPPATGFAPRLVTHIRADATLEWSVLIVP